MKFFKRIHGWWNRAWFEWALFISSPLPAPFGGWYRFWRDIKMGKAARKWRTALRAWDAQAEEAKRKAEEDCIHRQGGLGEYAGSLTSIVWHKLDRGGDVVGVCTECLRKFLPTDSDYAKWRKLLSGNRMSAGGQEAALIVSGSPGFPISTPVVEGLDLLSDEQIETLYHGVADDLKNRRITPAEAAAKISQVIGNMNREYEDFSISKIVEADKPNLVASDNWSSVVSDTGKPNLKATGWQSLNEPSPSWGKANHPSYRDWPALQAGTELKSPFMHFGAVAGDDHPKKLKKKPTKKSPAKPKKKAVKKGKSRAKKG